MISVLHFRSDARDFGARAGDALAALAARPGYLRGAVGRSTDDTSDWMLLSEWADVGSYRRALGSYDVKVRAAPLLGEALDVPGSFEQLIEVSPDGSVAMHDSDRGPGR